MAGVGGWLVKCAVIGPGDLGAPSIRDFPALGRGERTGGPSWLPGSALQLSLILVCIQNLYL